MTVDEQALIVEQPASERALVLAGAGTGKTEAAVRRLHWLAEREGVPGVDLLVLSFSRAAVAEVRRRLRVLSDFVAPVRISTLDSFASRLLRLYAPRDSWLQLDYEGRIREATVLIGTSVAAREELMGYRHVIVDEIQDLVGDRGEFVLAILNMLDSEAEFTILGDPAQGIYDFELQASSSKLAARELVRRIIDFSPTPTGRSLSKDHRAANPRAVAVATLGNSMRSDLGHTGGYAEREDQQGLLRLIEALATYDAPMAGKLIARRHDKERLTCGVLCRINSQALMISRQFDEAGVSHYLQPSADQPIASAWLGRALAGYRFATLAQRQFETLLERVMFPRHPPDLRGPHYKG